MSKTLPPILIVDDEKNMRLSMETVMIEAGYRPVIAESAEQALEFLERETFFMVVTDARLGGMSGYDLIPRIKQKKPDLPVLMITAYATPKLAVEALKAGAMDYLAKPFAPEELLHAVERCAERHRLIAENAILKARQFDEQALQHVIGDSASMRALKQLIQTVAPTAATVLILGESGTGKEVIAAAVHALSMRRDKNYVRINCAAIPESLLESELFGHEKGSFTGALRTKLGRFEEADGGTVFLDEIGDMSRPLQAKLLRFLEDGTFTRVGGNEELKVDVRLIAATNRDIITAIRDGHFREDLYHRLNVVQFRPPPLRDRGYDIILLAEHFLRQFSKNMNRPVKPFSEAARAKLLHHHWPGNVRELRNVVERAVILETEEEIQPGSLPDFQLETGLKKQDCWETARVAEKVAPIVAARKAPAAIDVGGRSLDEVLAEYEREVILGALEKNRYSLTRAAEMLKISRHALRYRMQRLNINLDAEPTTPAA